MSNNQINEDAKSDLLSRIDKLDYLIGAIGEWARDAEGSLGSLWSYVSALGAEDGPSLFVGSKPKKALAVGDLTAEGDDELLPIGSRVDGMAGHWEKTGEGEWTNGGMTGSASLIGFCGRKILRVGYDGPKRELELGDILFTKEDFEAVPEGHVVVEIVSPKNFYFEDGERANEFHYNIYADDPTEWARKAECGYYYYLYGGKPVPSADTELPLREAFDAWGANAIVEPIHLPGTAFTLSPDGAAYYACGKGTEIAGLQDATVRLVAVLDDGKVIPGKVEKPKAAFLPGDVVRIHGGPFSGMKGHVLRVDLDLDNPYLVRAEGTTGFGRYEADDLSFSHRSYVLRVHPGDRLRNLWTGKTHTVGQEDFFHDAPDYEFLMPKRVPKIGDVIDLKAARRLPAGSRVSVPGSNVVHWQKSWSGHWFCAGGSGKHCRPLIHDSEVFQSDSNRRLLRYGNGYL